VFNVLSSNSRLSFSSNAGTNTSVSSNNSVALDKWYHVAITRTATGIANFYINGKLSGIANQNSGAPINGTTNVIVGNRLAGDRSFAGNIMPLTIYNKVLLDSQIYSIFQAERGFFGV
jgi:hypothetical protein